MQEMIDGSKGRMYTDMIDFYWIHNTMDVEKWTPNLIPLAKSGQIKTIGVSNHNLAEIKRADEILAAEGLKVSAVQNHYSLLHRSSERAGILDASPAQVATAWAIAKGTLPIIGVTKVHQVEEAAKAAQIELTVDEISRLERFGDETGVHTVRE